MRVDILTRRSLQRSSSSSFSCSVTRNLMSLFFLGVPLCWGLCLVERVLVLVIVPPCRLTSSSLELCITAQPKIARSAKCEQGLGKALTNKYDRSVGRNFNL